MLLDRARIDPACHYCRDGFDMSVARREEGRGAMVCWESLQLVHTPIVESPWSAQNRLTFKTGQTPPAPSSSLKVQRFNAAMGKGTVVR